MARLCGMERRDEAGRARTDHGYVRHGKSLARLLCVDCKVSLMSIAPTNLPAPYLDQRRVVVTGAAGFIGSTVVDQLLDLGAEVVGIDDLDPWYGPDLKRANITSALEHPAFTFCQADVVEVIGDVLEANDLVIHLAGRPGVQDSWGLGFADYSRRNIEGTQCVFEEALGVGVARVVYASSSSIYGSSSAVGGDRSASPISPYGVSKLAGEQLAGVYAARGLDIVSLRYFTVYGPRQRPDMAMHRMFAATLLGDSTFVRRGDGHQRREFTFVGDVADATIRATVALGAAGAALDIGGGESASLLEVMDAVESIAGPIRTHTVPSPAGDPVATSAALEPTVAMLGWRPTTSLAAGLGAQAAWHGSRIDYSTVVEVD